MLEKGLELPIQHRRVVSPTVLPDLFGNEGAHFGGLHVLAAAGGVFEVGLASGRLTSSSVSTGASSASRTPSASRARASAVKLAENSAGRLQAAARP